MLENDAIMTRMMIERVSGKMISSFWEVVSDILQFGTIKYSMSDRPSLGTVSESESTTRAVTGAFRVAHWRHASSTRQGAVVNLTSK